MKKMLIFLFLFNQVDGWSQTNKTIVKAYGFYMIPTPGTIPVDDSGKEIKIKRDTVFTLVVEVKGKSPQWTSASYGSRSYSVRATQAQSSEVAAGKNYSDDKPIVVKGSKSNSLWELQLVPSGKKNVSLPKSNKNQLLLEGKLNGKIFYFTIASLTHVSSPQYQ